MFQRGLHFSSAAIGFAEIDDSGLIPQKMPSFLFESSGAGRSLPERPFVLSRAVISWFPNDRVQEQLDSFTAIALMPILREGSVSESETTANVSAPMAPNPLRGLGESPIVVYSAQDEMPLSSVPLQESWMPNPADSSRVVDYTFLEDGGIYVEPGQFLSMQTSFQWLPVPSLQPDPPSDVPQQWLYYQIILSFFLQEIS